MARNGSPGWPRDADANGEDARVRSRRPRRAVGARALAARRRPLLRACWTSTRASTWSAERSATCCSAGARSISTWSSRATPRRRGRAARRRARAPRPLRDRDRDRRTGFSYDIARARRETYARPGRAPRREPGDPRGGPPPPRLHRQRDRGRARRARRRASSRAVPGALEDLDARLLRVLHDRSFVDDPTRLLRLARYASRLGFEIEPHTRELALAAARGRGALATVSGPRIGAELRLLAREPDPRRPRSARCASWSSTGRSIPASGSSDEELARRALALLPDDGRPDRLALALAARGDPRRGAPATCWTGSGSRPPTATRSSPRRPVRMRWPGPCAQRERPSQIAQARVRGGPRARGARGRARPGGGGASVARAGCATSSSRSTGATSSRPACPRARRSAAGCARRSRPSSTDARKAATQELAAALQGARGDGLASGDGESARTRCAGTADRATTRSTT